MKVGYYLCGITRFGDTEEENLYRELYDKFTHNELSVHEVIEKVANFNGFDLSQADRYKEDYPEELYNKCFSDEGFFLSIGSFDEGMDVYLEDKEL